MARGNTLLVVLAALASTGARPPVRVTEAPAAEPEKRYVGSEACQECHPDEYDRFTHLALKARSYRGVEKMASRLTAAELKTCLPCHTTGYARPGGFESLEKTPHLANAGCESCHGPGSVHCQTQRREAIVRVPSVETCGSCHLQDGMRPVAVKPFTYRPLRYAGAH
ncbi:MAG TPA: cytochrome c family protein [Anaeromyxobacter sp.]|nr:cytochrome c family protein [Anaeromyxobacter sp.]